MLTFAYPHVKVISSSGLIIDLIPGDLGKAPDPALNSSNSRPDND
jgi:hypothetical protein